MPFSCSTFFIIKIIYFWYHRREIFRFDLQGRYLFLERFAEAIPDFKECVALFEEILDKNDRRIAEVNYNIGLALASDNNFDGAIQNYEKAVAIMKERIDSLKQKVEVAKETAGKEKISSEAEEWEKEITELNDIVMSDMMGKVCVFGSAKSSSSRGGENITGNGESLWYMSPCHKWLKIL